MKKILIVPERVLNGKGGIQTGIKHITDRLKDQYSFDAVVFDENSVDVQNEFKGIKNIYLIDENRHARYGKLFFMFYRPYITYREAKRILKANRYDVVHCHDIIHGACFLVAARKSGVKIRICHSHNSYEKNQWSIIKTLYYNVFKNVVIRNSNVKVGCSVDACKEMFRNSNDTFVINNELDLSAFDPHLFDQESRKPYSFINIGRFAYQKNHEFLIDVFYLIKKKLPNATLSLVGWGELETDVRNKVKALGLDCCVSFYPADSNIPKLLGEATYMIFPSRYEGLGRVVIEAQAMGVMCFASSIVPRETDLGLIEYYPLSLGVTEWSNKICDFVQSGDKSNYKLRTSALDNFSLEKVVLRYIEMYDGNLAFKR